MDTLGKALQVKACHLINQTLLAYNAHPESNKIKDNEIFQQAKVVMVKAHFQYVQFAIFRQEIETRAATGKNNEHLMTLLVLSALDNLISDTAAVYDTGFFAPGSLRAMQEAWDECVAKIRPQMIPLVECYYMPDHFKPSVIGNSYGDIYEWQLRNAMKSRINEPDVPRYFDELMKPVLRAKL